MKAQIHPTWKKAVVTCACGNTFEVGSVVDEIKVEVCSNCHPFYTGQMKYVDTAGRVDAFKARQAGKATTVTSKRDRRAEKRLKRVREDQSRPETLAELRVQSKSKKSN
jgi:large subunit ribosomal protein L31